jgi:plasmid maintenance system antidote protein VapI
LKRLSISADTLMRMQAAYELASARAHEDEIRVQPIQGGVRHA